MATYLVTCHNCGVANRIPADKEGKSGRCGSCHRTLPPLYLQPQQLDERNFDGFINNYGGQVIVEFRAPWCPYCREYEATVRTCARLLAGQAAVVQIDSQAQPGLAGRFGVRGIPVLFLLSGGRIVAQLPGVQSSEAVIAWFRQNRN